MEDSKKTSTSPSDQDCIDPRSVKPPLTTAQDVISYFAFHKDNRNIHIPGYPDYKECVSGWMYHHQNLLSMSMAGIAFHEVASANIIGMLVKAILLWKTIVRKDRYFGPSASELNDAIITICSLFLDTKNYTTMTGTDMSAYQDFAPRLLDLLKQRQQEHEDQKPFQQQAQYDTPDLMLTDSDSVLPASPEYIRCIVSKFYSDYPVKPFISMSRQANHPDWIKEAVTNPVVRVDKDLMMPLEDGLLPGHIWLMYWLENVDQDKVPDYFEYRYGICFLDSVLQLIDKGFLNEDETLSDKGKQALKTFNWVIEQH